VRVSRTPRAVEVRGLPIPSVRPIFLCCRFSINSPERIPSLVSLVGAGPAIPSADHPPRNRLPRRWISYSTPPGLSRYARHAHSTLALLGKPRRTPPSSRENIERRHDPPCAPRGATIVRLPRRPNPSCSGRRRGSAGARALACLARSCPAFFGGHPAPELRRDPGAAPRLAAAFAVVPRLARRGPYGPVLRSLRRARHARQPDGKRQPGRRRSAMLPIPGGGRPIRRGHPLFRLATGRIHLGAERRRTGGASAPIRPPERRGLIVLADVAVAALLQTRTCRSQVPLLRSKERARPTLLGVADEKDLERFVSKLGSSSGARIAPDAWKSVPAVNGVYSRGEEGDAMRIRVKIPQGSSPARSCSAALGRGRALLDRAAGPRHHPQTCSSTSCTLADKHRRRAAGACGRGTPRARPAGNSVPNVTRLSLLLRRVGAGAVRHPRLTPKAVFTRHLFAGPLSEHPLRAR